MKAAQSGRRGPLPPALQPQLATLVDEPPAGDDWVHELKLDGYRICARIEKGRVRLLTRAGNDWTESFPAVAYSLEKLPVKTAFLDGEVVVNDETGRSRFQLLQNALKHGHASLQYHVFDLVHLDGVDLRGVPLLARKDLLRTLLARRPKAANVHYSEHVRGNGAKVLAKACAAGEEGIISKLAEAAYTSGRTRTWLKVKCHRRQEFVIVGWTDPRGSRIGFGALLLAVYDDEGALRYAGKVGTGFGGERLTDLHRRLVKIARREPPVVDPRRAERGAHWVEPRLVAEVEFSEWTGDGKVRHPSFVALRSDKPASAVRREVEAHGAGAGKNVKKHVKKDGKKDADRGAKKHAKPRAKKPAPKERKKAATKASRAASNETSVPPLRNEVAGIRLSNPGRVYFPDVGVTKSELAQYWETVAPRALPLLRNRPLSLVRCPQGADQKCFFQKHAGSTTPKEVSRVPVNPGEDPYAMVTDLPSLIALVQLGVIEFHPWGSRAGAIEKPDLFILDLDPHESVPWRRLAETALVLRVFLQDLGFVPFLRTTGGKGLHVVVPLVRRWGWDEIKAFTRSIALRLVHEAPRQFTAEIPKAKRTGRILIDYLRNQRDATAIASYSPRARPGAPVAMPLDWDELDPGGKPLGWDVRSALERLAGPDPWATFEASRRPLEKKTLDLVHVE